MKLAAIRLYAYLVLGVCLSLPVKAQEQAQADAMKQINEIKLNNNYIWAEGTSSKSKKDALENALAVLKFEIQSWLNQSGQKDLAAVAMTSQNQYMKIETERRKIHRAFIYVPKSQIMPIGKDEKVVVVERQEAKPKKEKIVEEKPELESKVEEIYIPTDIEQEMLNVKRSSEMEVFINRYKINQTGKYRDRPKDGSYYIFIFNREGNVPACLKVVDSNIINVTTGKGDSFDNYKGCGGQWFILNK